MKQETIKEVDEIANILKERMQNEEIKAFHIEKKGISKQKIYSVLRMGKVARPNYTIETFIQVLNGIGIDLKEKLK